MDGERWGKVRGKEEEGGGTGLVCEMKIKSFKNKYIRKERKEEEEKPSALVRYTSDRDSVSRGGKNHSASE